LNKDGFSQNLISRQEEIDSVLIKYVQRERVREMNKKIVDIIKLSNLRNLIHLLPKTKPKPKPAPITIFKDILQQSKQMVSKWGGEMYFVYLPSFYSQTPPVQRDHYSLSEERNRKIVMQTATELDIPIIDIQNEVFKTHPDPLSLFPFRTDSHYNAEGYRLVAEAIRKQLDEDHYISIN
jgi:lysophospholipase L1-like esterase